MNVRTFVTPCILLGYIYVWYTWNMNDKIDTSLDTALGQWHLLIHRAPQSDNTARFISRNYSNGGIQVPQSDNTARFVFRNYSNGGDIHWNSDHTLNTSFVRPRLGNTLRLMPWKEPRVQNASGIHQIMNGATNEYIQVIAFPPPDVTFGCCVPLMVTP